MDYCPCSRENINNLYLNREFLENIEFGSLVIITYYLLLL